MPGVDTEPKAPAGRDIRPHRRRDGVPSVERVDIRTWSAEEALLRKTGLLLLMAYGLDGAPFGNRSFPPDTWLKAKEAITGEVLREFRDGCESAVPEVKVTTAAVDTGPISALIGAPAGEVAGLFAGVSASRLSSSAACPIVVVRGPHDAGPVVVGVDGSPLSEEALAWAFEEAANRKVPLVALHAWHDGDVAGLFTGEGALPFPADLCGRTKIASWDSGSRVGARSTRRCASTRSS